MRLTKTIDIAAPPEVVWEITADIRRWPEWQPTVKAVEVLEGDVLAVGLKARLTQPAIPKAVWTVLSVDPGRSFRWGARNMGMNFVGGHYVAPAATGTTSTLTLDVTGGVARLLGWMLTPALKNALRQESEGLKQRAEARAAGG